MKDTIVDLLNSKKFLAAIATIIGVVLAQAFGMDISDETLVQIISAISGLYIAAQGAADHGKSAAMARAMVEMDRIEALKAIEVAKANGSAPAEPETKPDPQ